MFHKLQQKATQIPENLLLVLSVFTGTFFVYRDFGIRMIFGYAVLGGLLMLHLFFRLRENKPLVVTPITMAVRFLACLIILQFFRPDARRDTDTISYLISMVICIAYVVTAHSEYPDLRLAGRFMYFCAMAMAAFVVIFTFLPDLFAYLIYPHMSITAQQYYDYFAPLGYGVSLGGYTYSDYILFSGIAVCCADLASNPRTCKRIIGNILSMSFLFLAMLILGRRGEVLALLVALALVILLLCNRKQRRIILVTGTVSAAAGVILVLMLLPYLRTIPVLTRYVQTIDQILSGTDFTSGRGVLMATAMTGFQSSPIFGIGWGQYLRISAQIGMYNIDGSVIEDCHNIYLQFLCETGIVGTVLLLIPIGYLFITTCRLLHAAKQMDDKTPLHFAVISFLLQFYFLFLGLYDPTFQKIVFWSFYALALILANAAMVRSGWRPTGPLTRGLDRLSEALAPAGDRVWTWLRHFVH